MGVVADRAADGPVPEPEALEKAVRDRSGAAVALDDRDEAQPVAREERGPALARAGRAGTRAGASGSLTVSYAALGYL